MRVSILDPKGVVWQGLSKEVVLPAEEGEMCVLDFHQPFLVKLKKDIIRLLEFGTQKSTQRIPIKNGIAFMAGNELKVFVER